MNDKNSRFLNYSLFLTDNVKLENFIQHQLMFSLLLNFNLYISYSRESIFNSKE